MVACTKGLRQVGLGSLGTGKTQLGCASMAPAVVSWGWVFRPGCPLGFSQGCYLVGIWEPLVRVVHPSLLQFLGMGLFGGNCYSSLLQQFSCMGRNLNSLSPFS